MLVRNTTPFPWGRLLASRRPPQPEMAVVVRGTFDIVDGSACVVTQGDPAVQGFVLGETLAEADDPADAAPLAPNDLVPFKLNAEVMVVGSCTAPGGRAVTELPVEVKLGAWSKGLTAVGRRAFSDRAAGGIASKPLPFTTMPVDYGRAYGGPGYDANRAGAGIASAEAPNLERTGERLSTRGQRPTAGPVALGALNVRWAPRAARIGKAYGEAWRKQRAPFFAEDFDYRYFHEAAADQQLAGYLRGDEAFQLTNLHPALPSVSGTLPGVRVRFFAEIAGRGLREVPLALDTVVVLADLGRIRLTWRGLVEVKDDDFEDVVAVVIATEPLGSPLPESFFAAEITRAKADVIPAAPPEVLALRDEALARTARVDAASERLRAGGGDKKDALADLMVAALPPEDPKTAEARSKVRAALDEHDAHVPPDKNRLADFVPPAPLPRSPPPLRDLPAGEAPKLAPNRKLAKSIDDAIDQVKASNEHLAHDASGKAGQQASEALARLEELKVDPRFGPVFKPRIEPGPGRDLSDQDLEGEDLRGANLEGANLEGAILTRADLGGARLKNARLTSAVLFQTVLDGADLEGASLSLANFTESKGEKASFRGVVLDRTFFEDARLDGADFGGATGVGGFFDRTSLVGAVFDRARIERTRFGQAKLDGATFEGADLLRVAFDHCRLAGASFAGARLAVCSLLGCVAPDASFVRVTARGCTLQESRLDGARFDHAALPGLALPKASLVGASFYGADLRAARAPRAVLDRASFERANLIDADLRKVSCHGTSFRGACLHAAVLLGASGKGADLIGANLTRCQIEGLT